MAVPPEVIAEQHVALALEVTAAGEAVESLVSYEPPRARTLRLLQGNAPAVPASSECAPRRRRAPVHPMQSEYPWWLPGTWPS